MRPIRESAWVCTGIAAMAAVLGILWVYWGLPSAGFYYDDYHFLRPPLPMEWRRVWFGTWDPTGIEKTFFRPLTAWWFLARFWAFGLNAPALHVLSLGGHLLCAVMVAWVLRGERVAASTSVAGAWLYAIHPALPFAQVSWLTNQMHLAESIVVLSTILVWQQIRDRAWFWHLTLVPLAATAFFFKEDGVMLLPVIAALTLWRQWGGGGGSTRRTAATVALTMAAVIALVAFRQVRLGQLGGYGVPSLTEALVNASRGPLGVGLLWPTRNPWRAVASVIAIGALAIGLLRMGWGQGRRAVFIAGVAAMGVLAIYVPSITLPRAGHYPLVSIEALSSGVWIAMLAIGCGMACVRRDREALIIIGAGATILLLFNAPFVLVAKREQFHVLALGAVLVGAGAFSAWIRVSAPGTGRIVAMTAGLVSTVPLALMGRASARDFAPCAPHVLEGDAGTSGWPIVPREVKAWLESKPGACQANAPGRVTDLPLVTWGLYDPVVDEGDAPYQWTSDVATVLVARDIPSIRLDLRSPTATPAHATIVRLRTGGAEEVVTLTSSAWATREVTVRDDLVTALRQARRLEIMTDGWFVPAVVTPASADLRRLGVQVRLHAGR